MNQVGEITLGSGNNIPVIFDDSLKPLSYKMRIYNDGTHYVASYVMRSKNKVQGSSKAFFGKIFEELYYCARKEGLKGYELHKYVKEGYESFYGSVTDDFIAKRIKRLRHNLKVRIKRFNRKAYLNRWNYFVTFTYDDAKQTEESFRRKIRRCLCNLKTRRNWRYMGVFESAPETGRLHFHGLFYVPPGEMIGKIVEKKDYSTAKHKMQITHANTFFEKKFGRNDFVLIDDEVLKVSGFIDYILKYIDKSGERIICSRGVPAEIIKDIFPADIAAEFWDFVNKFVLFDGVVSWERDIRHFTPVQLKIRFTS